MLTVLSTVFVVLAFLLVIGRSPVVPLLLKFEPPAWRWAWAPPAALVCASVLSDGVVQILGWTPTFDPAIVQALALLRLVLDAASGVLLAYQQGHQPPMPEAAAIRPAPPIRIPPALMVVPLVFMATLLSGCAPSLGSSLAAGARAPGVAAAAPATDGAQAKRCRRLDRTESTLRWVSRGAAVLAGGSGLATIPVEDPDGRSALAVSAAVAGVGAAAAEAVRAEVAADLVEECQP